MLRKRLQLSLIIALLGAVSRINAVTVVNRTQTTANSKTAEGIAFFTSFLILAGLLFGILVMTTCWPNRFWYRFKRRQNLKNMPFHWLIIKKMNLSSSWIYQLEVGDGAMLKNFIDGLPVEGLAPSRGQMSSYVLIPERDDFEQGFLPLRVLAMHRRWCETREAHCLAYLIADVLRKSDHLEFQSIKTCGLIPGDGYRFDPSKIRFSRVLLEREVVGALRESSVSNLLLRRFRVNEFGDRLRRHYETLHFVRDSDPFALLDQRLSIAWQPLELLTHHRTKPVTLSLRDTITTYDHQTPGDHEERWVTTHLESLMSDGQMRLLLKGENGAGKTTWCRRLAERWSVSDGETHAWLSSYRCLLLISLGDWLNHITEVESQSIGSRRERIHYWLTEGVWHYSLDTVDAIGYKPPLREVLFVLDGYDEVVEVAASRDSLLGDVLHHLLQARGAYAAPNVIITTRPQVDLTHHRDFVDQARVCRIKGPSREHQADFVRQFFGEQRILRPSESSPILLSQAFQETLGQHSTLRQLQNNPLLLKMMCWLYFDQAHLPTLFDASSPRLTPFYEKTIGALKRRRSIMSSDVPICDRLLKRLAHQREVVITSSRVAEVFSALEIQDQTEQQRLLNVLSVDLGLLQPLRPRTDPLNCHWEFLHESFQEYYRALALIDELLSGSAAMETVFNELRLSAQEDGQLGYFLVGLLSTHPDERLTPILQSFINRAIDSCTDSSSLIVWTWRLLREVSSSQRSRLKLPGLEVFVRIGWLPRAIEATGSIELCNWLMSHVPTSDKRAWLQWANDLRMTALHMAAFCGHRFVCQWLLKQVLEEDRLAWIQQPAAEGLTILHLAAEKGHESLCHWLVEQVPEEDQLAWIQKTSREGWTALHLAAQNGHESVCRWLVEQVPEEDRLVWIQQTTEEGWTALHLAIEKGHNSLCYWLADQVSEEDLLVWIQRANKEGWTVLHLASKEGHKSLCRWLVQQVPEEDQLAWIQKASKEGWTALHMAAQNRHESMCRWLVERVPEGERLAWIQQTNKEGWTALHLAASNGHGFLCRWLVAQIPEERRLAWIQKSTDKGSTGLHLAAANGHESMCQWLVQQVPKEDRLVWIQRSNKEGWTALHLAAGNGQESMCRWLVDQVPEAERLAWIQRTDRYGKTVLHEVARNGHRTLCRWLLKMSPNQYRLLWIKQPDVNGVTPLHLAASQGHEPVCHELLDRVPKRVEKLTLIERHDHTGRTVWHWAARGGHLRLLTWLLSQISKTYSPAWVREVDGTILHEAAWGGHLRVCQWLLKQLPEAKRLSFLTWCDPDGKTALHIAASECNEAVCRWFISELPDEERSVQVRQKDLRGRTALSWLARRGHEPLCRWLMELVPEADRLLTILQEDANHKTVLHWTAAKGHLSLLTWFVSLVSEEHRKVLFRHADRTILHDAALGGHLQVCQWLVDQLTEKEALEFILQLGVGGTTALYEAAWGGHLAVCQWLLEQLPREKRYSFLTQLDREGKTVLYVAAREGHHSVCQWLIQKISPEERSRWVSLSDRDDMTALHAAAQRGHQKVCEVLVGAFTSSEDLLACVRRRDIDGKTALHWMAERGRVKLVEWLLNMLPVSERTDMVNEKDASGNTVLDYLSRKAARRMMMTKSVFARGVPSIFGLPAREPPLDLSSDILPRASTPCTAELESSPLVGLAETKGEPAELLDFSSTAESASPT